MQGPHPLTHLIDGGAHGGGVGEAPGSHGATQDTQFGVLIGDQVGAAHARQLGAMFDRSQETIAGGQVGGIAAGDVSSLAQGIDRVERRGHAQERVGATVDELQQLDGELDVTQSPSPEFEFP